MWVRKGGSSSLLNTALDALFIWILCAAKAVGFCPDDSARCLYHVNPHTLGVQDCGSSIILRPIHRLVAITAVETNEHIYPELRLIISSTSLQTAHRVHYSLNHPSPGIRRSIATQTGLTLFDKTPIIFLYCAMIHLQI